MKTFHVGDVLSVLTGRLHGPNGMDGVYRILSHLTGDEVYTHQIPRVMKSCQPFLRECFPNLPTDGYFTPEEAVARFGTQLAVPPMPADKCERKDPVQEAVEMFGADRVAVVTDDRLHTGQEVAEGGDG